MTDPPLNRPPPRTGSPDGAFRVGEDHMDTEINHESKISEIQRATLEGAGREIARDWQDEGGSAKALLTAGITREGDVSYLDGVAETVGFDGGMPDGYKRPRHPAWEAVLAGIQAVADGAPAQPNPTAKEGPIR